MKNIILYAFSLSILLNSCKQNKDVKIVQVTNTTDVVLEIPNINVNKSDLLYKNKTSQWILNDQLYSGYAVSYYEDGTLKEKIGILNGRKENKAKHWYPKGNNKIIANYHKGKLQGEKKVWSSDSVLLSHLNYQSGKPHGEQKTWYPTGELHKRLNLDRGREVGAQQAFRKNGALYANYEAREGRIFGLKKAALCYGLEQENILYEK